MKKSNQNIQITKGYKVTDANMKCLGFQYKLNKKFVHKGSLDMCRNGFHFCPIAAHCFNYYTFDSNNRVFEIVSYGEIITDCDKCCTGEIEFIKELTWDEVLVIVNTGKDNSGYRNSGDRNSGDRNSGDRNSGYRNSGNWNSGDRNSGNWNSGDRNSGDRNSGYRNSGDWNSGNWNSGDRNSGDSNSGYRNSGNWNSGYRNSGDSNSGYRNSGAFCTSQNPCLILFDVQTNIPVKEWENGEACLIMSSLDTTIWVDSSYMTAGEKAAHPKHETTGGYLKTIPYKEAWANLWHNLNDTKRAVFTSLPHFNSDKFKEITGIDVNSKP